MDGTLSKWSSVKKTDPGSAPPRNSPIFLARSSSIKKSMATFPTLPIPGSPSIRMGLFNFGLLVACNFQLIITHAPANLSFLLPDDICHIYPDHTEQALWLSLICHTRTSVASRICHRQSIC